MGQAVANPAIGTKDKELIRYRITDVLADSVADALVRGIVNAVAMDNT